MKLWKKLFAQTTYGQLTIALFLICGVSGVFLAIPYDVAEPYRAVSTMRIASPAASLFRNLHFWSAQLFLIFTFLHMWDHFRKTEKIKLKKGLWLRMCLGVLIIFLAMLTGFLLKGDADSRQARQILESLTAGIPVAGSLLAYSLLGKAGDYQLIYVHHIATFTVFIAVMIFEHARKIWPKWGGFVLSLSVLLVLSYFFSAPLHDNLHPTVKGPWYFVGLQEILHWLTIPGLSLLFVLLVLGLIYLVPFLSDRGSFIAKRSLLIITILYLLLSAEGLFFRGQNWQWMWPGEKGYTWSVLHAYRMSRVVFGPDFNIGQVVEAPLINGRKESCTICHSKVSGFTLSHNPEALGCASCHGGNPLEPDKNKAHQNMRLIPGNLSDASMSCGTVNCHPEITQRINSGLMATLSGMISVDRFVFNEEDHPDVLTDLHHLAGSPADEHLKNLCVRCHLGNPKTEWGTVGQHSRGGGCLACHLNYEAATLTALLEHNKNTNDTSYLKLHPSISLKVTNEHCFGCHSRSGRISTNYEGWHETILSKEEMPDGSLYRLVEDKRVFRYVQDDVHHALEMECIDCHNSYELMGDGKLYAHQENQQTVHCSDCHFTGKPETIEQQNLDQEAALITGLRYGHVTDREFLLTAKRNQVLINTFYENDTAFLLTKNKQRLFKMKPPKAVCSEGKAHKDLSCSACHTSWAPSCFGCHNEYDAREPGYNMLTNKEESGSWVEFVGEYNAHPPALGIRVKENEKSIIPVVPGMVLTIDVSSFTKQTHDSLIFQRLFAPAAPHTTSKAGRSCQSCHNNPVALGYGKGKLEFTVKNGLGRWTFDPAYQNNLHDGLPEDAWIGFLQERTGKVSTRSDVRPFSIQEQQNILTVGACLTCHKESSLIMQQSLSDFKEILRSKKGKCALPVWE
ncbi:MAG: cytochrome b N-terminal domain-containing protein [Bacteroidales bacterium]|nr:cytochrome b N-terminal domain-containing protein [Bacteroidales bacterium]